MSFTAIRTAFRHISQKELSPTAKLVLLALANRHNQETGRCDPSLATIEHDIGMSEGAVRGGLRMLEKTKCITTTYRKEKTGRGKKNLTNRYRILSGAKSAGTKRQNLPPKQEPKPSKFDDLCFVLDDQETD